jgi:hypothetical protein
MLFTAHSAYLPCHAVGSLTCTRHSRQSVAAGQVNACAGESFLRSLSLLALLLGEWRVARVGDRDAMGSKCAGMDRLRLAREL